MRRILFPTVPMASSAFDPLIRQDALDFIEEWWQEADRTLHELPESYRVQLTDLIGKLSYAAALALEHSETSDQVDDVVAELFSTAMALGVTEVPQLPLLGEQNEIEAAILEDERRRAEADTDGMALTPLNDDTPPDPFEALQGGAREFLDADGGIEQLLSAAGDTGRVTMEELREQLREVMARDAAVAKFASDLEESLPELAPAKRVGRDPLATRVPVPASNR